MVLCRLPYTPVCMSDWMLGKSLIKRSKTSSGGAQSRPMMITLRLTQSPGSKWKDTACWIRLAKKPCWVRVYICNELFCISLILEIWSISDHATFAGSAGFRGFWAKEVGSGGGDGGSAPRPAVQTWCHCLDLIFWYSKTSRHKKTSTKAAINKKASTISITCFPVSSVGRES